MPVYDLRCVNGHDRRDVLCSYAESLAPCPDCAGAVSQIPSAGRSVQPDSVPGGFVVQNGFREPQRFFSRSEHRAALAAKGLQLADFAHQPVPGSDKSPFSTNWAALGPGTLERAAAMVARVTSPSSAAKVKQVRTMKGPILETLHQEPPAPITVTLGDRFRYRGER